MNLVDNVVNVKVDKEKGIKVMYEDFGNRKKIME